MNTCTITQPGKKDGIEQKATVQVNSGIVREIPDKSTYDTLMKEQGVLTEERVNEILQFNK